MAPTTTMYRRLLQIGVASQIYLFQKRCCGPYTNFNNPFSLIGIFEGGRIALQPWALSPKPALNLIISELCTLQVPLWLPSHKEPVSVP